MARDIQNKPRIAAFAQAHLAEARQNELLDKPHHPTYSVLRPSALSQEKCASYRRAASYVCLSTGARWGEAEALRVTQSPSGVIQFVQAKSSKARGVPITKDLEAAFKKHYTAHSGHEDNAESDDEKIFSTAYSAFRDGLKRSELN
ncbi:hypothetical protein RBA41_31060 [Massilia sp. CCM 9210]|uniref:hypothetical protein n=1 Tax=Massilia scottii TaxID=3057166 RepID=UPI00279689EA|nr:hypothetical protein [Massilia sp. CCM 9210]MDQ1817749.1 hypothetical protein [Massilia sp. CCM 9210]